MKIKQGFIKRKIQDKYVVVATGDASKTYRNFIELNQTASVIWDEVKNGKTIEQIAELFVKEYGITIEKATQDINKIVSVLIKEGVICE